MPTRVPFAGLAAIALVLAACSSAPSPSSSESPPAASASQAPASPSQPASPSEGGAPSAEPTPLGGSGETIAVVISNRSFGPDITIAAGTMVEFANQDSLPHTVTHGQNGIPQEGALFDVAVGPGGTTDPILFDTPGTYAVTCKIHPTMNLTITVV